jgi:hypothetical protein
LWVGADTAPAVHDVLYLHDFTFYFPTNLLWFKVRSGSFTFNKIFKKFVFLVSREASEKFKGS